MRFDDLNVGELAKIELLRPVEGLQVGEQVLIDWWGEGCVLYSSRLRQETGNGVIRLETRLVMDRDFIYPKGRWGRRAGVESGEWPHFLMPCYVPHVFYHGHHLYFDGWWLRSNGNHKEEIIKRYIASLFGKSLEDFPYWQAFCEFFMEQYPEGCYLEDLENAAAKVEP